MTDLATIPAPAAEDADTVDTLVAHEGTEVSLSDYRTVPLSALPFTDLFMNQMGECRVRGVSVRDEASGKPKIEPLTHVDPTTLADLEALLSKVSERGEREREFTIRHDEVSYRVSRIDDQTSTWYHLRKLISPIPRLQHVCRDREVFRLLGQAGKPRQHGLILMSGPTGEGKTTSMFSILQEYLLVYGDVGYTIEDPPEMDLSGAVGTNGQCYQIKVTDGDFQTKVTEALRCRPRYIMMGEIRDSGAASELLRAANSGHVVLSTIHAGTIPEAVQSLARYVAGTMDDELARHLMASCLSLVINQRLIQTVSEDDTVRRFPRMEVMQVQGQHGVQSKIRNGHYKQLESDVEQQSNERAERAKVAVREGRTRKSEARVAR